MSLQMQVTIIQSQPFVSLKIKNKSYIQSNESNVHIYQKDATSDEKSEFLIISHPKPNHIAAFIFIQAL